MNDALIQCMRKPGPKKILTCDGGGILGLMSVEILARLEDDLRHKLMDRRHTKQVCADIGNTSSAQFAQGEARGLDPEPPDGPQTRPARTPPEPENAVTAWRANLPPGAGAGSH